MKNLCFGVVLLVSFSVCLNAQMLVKMSMPSQPKESLKVVTLYDENLPINTTVVLGVMGYGITGGTPPYVLTWLKDKQVIATGDVAIIQPVFGSSYELKVTDAKACVSTVGINLSVSAKSSTTSKIPADITVSPTIVNKILNVNFEPGKEQLTQIRIFDSSGMLKFQKEIVSSAILDINLAKGNYFVVINTQEKSFVEKIIVK